MARTGKVSISYFSHDVDIMQDNKIKLLKARFGLIGYAVYIRLLEELYRSDGYYLKIDEDFNILFSDENKMDYDNHLTILNFLLEKGLFDNQLYQDYSILTSKRVQVNYCAAISRRTKATFIKEYLLVNPDDEIPKSNSKKIDVSILKLNDNILVSNDDTGTQSKEKEKEIESTVNKSKELKEFLNSICDLYPNNNGKNRMSEKKIKELMKVGYDNIKIAVDRYLHCVQVERDGGFKRSYKDCCTFFNTGYKDYLDGEYKPVDVVQVKKETKNTEFLGRLVGEYYEQERCGIDVNGNQRMLPGINERNE